LSYVIQLNIPKNRLLHPADRKLSLIYSGDEDKSQMASQRLIKVSENNCFCVFLLCRCPTWKLLTSGWLCACYLSFLPCWSMLQSTLFHGNTRNSYDSEGEGRSLERYGLSSTVTGNLSQNYAKHIWLVWTHIYSMIRCKLLLCVLKVSDNREFSPFMLMYTSQNSNVKYLYLLSIKNHEKFWSKY